MNEEQAKKIAASMLDGSTITEIEDFGELYAICFVNDEYLISGYMIDLKIGAGSIFIEKSTGNVFETGSARSASDYVKAYKATGDVYATLSSCVMVTNFIRTAEKAKSIMSLKNLLGTKLSEAKDIVEKVADRNEVRIDFQNVDEAEKKIAQLHEIGFLAKHLWNNQC